MPVITLDKYFQLAFPLANPTIPVVNSYWKERDTVTTPNPNPNGPPITTVVEVWKGEIIDTDLNVAAIDAYLAGPDYQGLFLLKGTNAGLDAQFFV